MFKFVQSVNAATEKPLSEKLLRKMFDRAWPDFFEMHNDFRSKSDADADAKPRSVEDMVAEVLDRLREVESSTHYMSGQLRAALVNYATNARDEYEAFAARQEILDRIGDMVMTDLNCVGIGESGRSGYWIAFDPPLRPGTKARLVNHIAEELGFAANFMLSIRGPQGTPTDRYRIKHGTATRTSVRPDRNR